MPSTPAGTGSEDEADGTEQVVEATVHGPAPSPDVQQGAHGSVALNDVVVPVVPPEGLQADQDAVFEELAGAGSEAENDNANNTAPRGADTDEEEIYPVAPVGGSPVGERMETLPPPSPEESDQDVGVDDRDEPPRPQRGARDRDEHRRVAEPQLVRDGTPRGTDPYPTYGGFRTVPVSPHDRVGNQLAPAVPGRPKTIRVDAEGRILDPYYYGTHGPLPRFCFRLQVHPRTEQGRPAPRLFTRAIIYHQVNMFLGTWGFPLATEVTPLSDTEALIWRGKRCNNEGWPPGTAERIDVHFSRWGMWMGQPTQMGAVMLPVEEGRRMLARAQQRVREQRAAGERLRTNREREERNRRASAATLVKKIRKGASPRSSRGPPSPRAHPARRSGRLPARRPLSSTPNTSSARAAVTMARMTRQFRHQELESPRGPQLADSPESPDPDDDSEFLSEEEEETATEAETPASETDEDEDHGTEAERERTSERSRWMRSYTRKSPGVWELRSPKVRPPRPRPYGAHSERRQPAVERTHRGYETDWGPRVPRASQEHQDDAEMPYEETPSVLGVRGDDSSPHKKTRRSRRQRDAVAGRTSRQSGSGSDHSHRNRDRDRSPRDSQQLQKHRRLPYYNGDDGGGKDKTTFQNWLYLAEQFERDTQYSERYKAREIMGSLVGDAAVIMQRLNEKGGPPPTAADVINAAKSIFGRSTKFGKLVGEFTAVRQMKGESVRQYICRKVQVGVRLRDHPDSPFTPQGYRELEATSIYDGLLGEIRAQITTEKGAGTDMFLLVEAAKEAEEALRRDKDNPVYKPESKRHGDDEDRGRRSDAPFSQRHTLASAIEEAVMHATPPPAVEAPPSDEDDNPAQFVARIAQISREEQGFKRPCKYCKLIHDKRTNPWYKCAEMLKAMTAQLNSRSGAATQEGTAPLRPHQTRDGQQTGLLKAPRPPAEGTGSGQTKASPTPPGDSKH